MKNLISDDRLLRADPAWALPPLQLPLTGAWFCKTFSPLLMPWLYGLALLRLLPQRLIARNAPAPNIAALMERYPSSLFPTLASFLASRLFRDLKPTGCASSLNIGFSDLDWQADEEVALFRPQLLQHCDVPTASIDICRLNNIIHQVDDRGALLREAARIVRPGGFLQLTENTRGWVEAIWLVRAARFFGKTQLAQRLIQDKLQSTNQNLILDQSWWYDQLGTDDWAAVEVSPYFSATSMTISSIFESLNFKQGGTSPDWLTSPIARSPLLSGVFRRLVGSLNKALIQLDGVLMARSEGVFLMVTLQRTGRCS